MDRLLSILHNAKFDLRKDQSTVKAILDNCFDSDSFRIENFTAKNTVEFTNEDVIFILISLFYIE